jgi:prevent-host-death family protein
MKVVKTAEAKNNLSRYLEYVRRGGRVRILDRDEPVADLVPIEHLSEADEDDALLASLARRGLVRLGKPGPMPKDLLRAGPKVALDGAVAALLSERRRSR